MSALVHIALTHHSIGLSRKVAQAGVFKRWMTGIEKRICPQWIFFRRPPLSQVWRPVNINAFPGHFYEFIMHNRVFSKMAIVNFCSVLREVGMRAPTSITGEVGNG